MKKGKYYKGVSKCDEIISNNEFKDDIVFARFINYMQIALYHKKLDYNKHQEFLRSQEENLSNSGWSVLFDKNSVDHPLFALNNDYSELNIAISKLTEKQRYVIINHYYNKKSLSAIANSLNMNDNAVYQLKVRALLSLRRFMED